MILLDTCALLWLAHDRKQLSKGTLRAIAEAPAVCISAITAFEIGINYRAGKLRLSGPPAPWLSGIMEHREIAAVDLSAAICLKASELPTIHQDPCDRLIIATALMKNVPVVSTDSRFKPYGIEVLG
jgi:PIN domain nuclease of toxin-antitoxin system